MLKFIKEWMLPIAIILGVVSYLILYYVPPFAVHIEPGFSVFAKKVQPMLIATMLFLQFNKISPRFPFAQMAYCRSLFPVVYVYRINLDSSHIA